MSERGKNRYPGVYHRRRDVRTPWWISYTANGKRVREPGGATQKDAWEKRRDQLRAIAERRYLPRQRQRITVRESVEGLQKHLETQQIKSPGFYAAHGKAVIDRIGEMRLVDVDGAALDEYIAGRRRLNGQPAARATVNKDLQVLRQAMRLAQERRQLAEVPVFHLLRENNARQGFFTREQTAALVAALPEPYADVVRWAFWSGWRRGDIRSLTWDMVHRGELAEVRLPETKEGEPRVLAIAGEIAAILERRWVKRVYVRGRAGRTVQHVARYVFHRRGQPIGDWRKEWVKACTVAGITGKRFHDLRRSALRELRLSGVPDPVAMSMSGHRTMSTYLRYQITSAEEQRAAIATRAAVREHDAHEHPQVQGERVQSRIGHIGQRHRGRRDG